MKRLASIAASCGYLLVLVAFWLPWYTVSCGGTPMARATGAQSAVNAFQSTSEFRDLGFRVGPDGARGELPMRHRLRWPIVVPIAALAGIAAAVAYLRGRTGAGRWMPIAGLVIVAEQIVDVARMNHTLHSPPYSRMPYTLEVRYGWVLALVGALVGAVAGALVWIRRPSEPPMQPD